MRIRQIKPGILSNEEIAAIGPYAYILFTGLWMIADREGRFEWRPKRIKALAMPVWDDVSSEMVENLLESLSKSQFIHSYEVAGKRYAFIVNWFKHQHPDTREAASQLPPPPTVNGAQSIGSEQTEELPRQDAGIPQSKRVGSWKLEVGTGSGGERKTTSSVEKSRPTPPPPNGTQPKTQRKQPARSTELHPEDGPQEAPPKARSPDFWPHTREDVQVIRASLDALGRECGLPPPDDDLIRRVLDVGRGCSGFDIHGVLRSLLHRGKFREMRSWGLVPLVVEQWCRVRTA